MSVTACETRPLLQGSRLTAWELTRAGIAVRVITDGMAAPYLRSGQADVVLVGADAWNPAFDVTPAALVSAFVTDRGVHRAPFAFAA